MEEKRLKPRILYTVKDFTFQDKKKEIFADIYGFRYYITYITCMRSIFKEGL